MVSNITNGINDGTGYAVGELSIGTDPKDDNTDNGVTKDGIEYLRGTDPIYNSSDDSQALTWYVNINNTSSGNGRSWTNAFKYFADAIRNMGMLDGDQIWFAAGTYIRNSTDISINKAISIYGGFTGTTETQLSQRNFDTNVTIVDGVNTENISCFFLEKPCTIDGFTIKRAGSSSSGDGITAYGATKIAN